MFRRMLRRNGGYSRVWSFGFVFIPALFLLLLILGAENSGSDDQHGVEGKMAEINEHLDHLRMLDKEKSKAFMELKSQVQYLMSVSSGKNSTGNLLFGNWTKGVNGTSPQQRAFLLAAAARNGLLANMSISGMDLAVPNLYDHLPHLLNRPGGLTPAVKLANKHRRGLHTVIGIPTIRRPKVSYLVTTLRSLLDNLSPEEKSEVMIVVFVGDEYGVSEFVSEQIVLLQSEFSTAIQDGVLEILVPPSDFYPPDLDSLPSTFGDPLERMRWRTKQNLDYAYLMMYCQNRARYYMQLEDDVITKPNYFAVIKDFITKQSAVPWMLLEFSSLGFIGKLFKSSDLPVVIDFLLMFHREKPVDWLLDHIFYVKFCNPEKSPKQCQAVKNKFRLRYKPSLFQHIGVHSSLRGKVQKLKERDFGKQLMHKPHSDNPPAKVSTSLKVYQKFTLERAYKGDTFFWGLLPQANDWIKIELDPPIRLEGFLFRSGNPEHPDDKFTNTSVEVKFSKNVSMGQGPLVEQAGIAAWSRTQDGYLVVSSFSQSGASQATLNTTSEKVECIRIVTHSESESWVILNEIWIKPWK